MVILAPIDATRSLDTGSMPSTARDDSVGRALRGVGQAVGQVADVVAHQQKMMSNRDKFGANQALRQTDAEIDAEIAQLDIDPSGAGYTQAVRRLVKTKYDAFAATLPPWLQSEFKPQLAASAAVWEASAVKGEVAQSQRWYSDGIDQIVDDHAETVFNNPDLLEAAIGDTDLAIAESGLHSATAEEKRRSARIRLEGEVAARRLRDDPNGLMDRLGVATPESLEGYFAVIRQAESGGEPDARNPNSSATGLYQFTTPTWTGLMERYPNAGLTADGRTDPRQQDIAVRLFTAESDKALAGAGIAVNNASRYAAHFLGATGAIPVLKAPDGAAMAGLVDAKVIKANPFLRGMTVGEFKAWAAEKVGGSPTSSPVAPEFADLPFDTRRELYDRAASAGRVGVEMAVDNAPVAIQSTGTYTGRMPTPQDFVAVYGAEGPARYQAFNASVDVAQQAYRMRTMPASDIAALVTAATPTSTGADAELQQGRYEALSKASDATIKARNADPGTYTIANFPEVADAWQAAQEAGADPSAYGKALSVTMAAQERLGIASPVLLPKAMATQAVSSWKNIELPEIDRANGVATLISNAGTPEQQRAVFRQLVDAGLPESAAGAVDALVRGDQGAASRLFRAALVDVSKLPGTSPEKPAAIDQAIQDRLLTEGAVGDLFYGLSDGDVLNLERARQDAPLIRNAVELRLRAGESLDQAVDAVGRDLFGDVVPVRTSNVSVLIDRDADPQAAATGFQQLLPQVRAALEAQTALRPDLATADSSKALFTAIERNSIERIMVEGEFRNGGDGFVFVDPRSGLAVEGADGQPLVFTLDQVTKAAESAPAPVDPVEAERAWLEQQAKTFGSMGGSPK